MHECMYAYMPSYIHIIYFYISCISGGTLPSQWGKAEKKSKKRKKHQMDEEEPEADRTEPSISCMNKLL